MFCRQRVLAALFSRPKSKRLFHLACGTFLSPTGDALLTVSGRNVRKRTACRLLRVLKNHAEAIMNTRPYPWRTAFLCAVFETDHTRMPVRINKATKAIEARLASRDQLDAAENRALEEARSGLATLQAEEVESLVDRKRVPVTR